ncbi:3-deoxy-D-manno-octulosonic acid transferase [Roseomonas sp. OT10]|uniref:3-deoxy-D-manno-octulosonic acid transferase n=1 Tax=Roseomonas cutis TaxID=2897332 RepID=UPI001E362BC3|nr:3-deoxy-D-manno-octulosonic acid transferase [Roseomonas sp. OT10]UFN51212.1 3-deoxy-D-manno-octulosonic acid transferase [Roseomonas sp. OT10]
MNPVGRLWSGVARVTAPLWRLHLRRRVAKGKEIAARLHERRGEGAARPPGPLLWLHAASVGESLSLLPLLEALDARRPDLHFLVTTGTVTSAELLLRRLPDSLRPRVTHRFAPLDVPAWTARFLDGWRPDAGVFVESELWPNLLAAARRRGVPMALLNARLSARSARAWRWAPGLARRTLSTFHAVLAQTEEDAARLRELGAPAAEGAGNLKYAAAPLPCDTAELARLRRLLAGRPVLLGASTHPGEEALLALVQAELAGRLPGLLTILVPRHPERGAALARELPGAVRRSEGRDPGPATGLWIADTLGELGLFYRLAGAAVIGKSLLPPGGGQNPLEPARLGCPVILGPHMQNFAAIADRLAGAGGAVRLPDAAALADAAAAVLTDPQHASRLRHAAGRIAAEAAGLADRMAAVVMELLPPR